MNRINACAEGNFAGYGTGSPHRDDVIPTSEANCSGKGSVSIDRDNVVAFFAYDVLEFAISRYRQCVISSAKI